MADRKPDLPRRVLSEEQKQEQGFSVRDELQGAIRQRLERISELLESARSADVDPENISQQIKTLALEVAELANWAYPEVSTLTSEERERRSHALAERYLRAGATMKEVLELAEVAGKRTRGRPATIRPTILAAFEMRRSRPKMSWMQLTNSVCPCDKERHDMACRERIRTAVRELEDFMERMSLNATERAAQED